MNYVHVVVVRSINTAAENRLLTPNYEQFIIKYNLER